MSIDEDSVEEFRRLAEAEEAACLRRAAIESRIESARRIYYQPAAKRPKRNGEVTVGEKVRITFPAKKGHQ